MMGVGCVGVTVSPKLPFREADPEALGHPIAWREQGDFAFVGQEDADEPASRTRYDVSVFDGYERWGDEEYPWGYSADDVGSSERSEPVGDR
jgi:hypothetical protein